MSELILYHADYSTCSQKVRLLLAEKNLSYSSKRMSFRKEEQLSESYLKINPNGVVPSLVHNEDVIVDSSCILEYLDEVFPQNSFSPNTALEKSKMRSWLRFMEEIPTKAIRIPSFEQIFLPTLRIIKSEKSFEKLSDKRKIRRGFYSNMNNGKGFEKKVIDNSLYELRSTVVRIDEALKTSPWILGHELSLVDLTILPLIDRAQDLGMNFLWNDLPRVSEWLSQLQERASFKKAFYKGSRLSERLEFKLAVIRARKINKNIRLSDITER